MERRTNDGLLSTPDATGPAPVKTAVAQRIGAELAAVHVARLLAAPAELAVPLVRRIQGKSGVDLLAGFIAQGNAVAAAVAVRQLKDRGQFRGRSQLVYGAIGAVALSPLLALRVPLVVAHSRSPLWGIAAQAATTVPVSLAMAAAIIRTTRSARDDPRDFGSAGPLP